MTDIWENDHIVRVAGETHFPVDPASEVGNWRKRVEPWLSAVFQAEHLSLLMGNGFTTAIAQHAGAEPVGTGAVKIQCANADKVYAKAAKIAATTGRGEPNIEDQLSAALTLLSGLEILGHKDESAWKTAIDDILRNMGAAILATEEGIRDGLDKQLSPENPSCRELLVSFLMSFASRAASRQRLNIFTTNYDRVTEKGADIAGLRLIDRFIGTVEPEFRASRLQVDMHYQPPGVRAEPRHLEGVVYMTKLHGSVDWRYEKPRLYRMPLLFGAKPDHTDLVTTSCRSAIIYPNAAKDVETAVYPYAELFRDFSASLCRPNSVLVTYGYGFGDDHVNRIIADMLTIPSSHLVIIAWSEKPHTRIANFLERVGRPQQLSLLLGRHFGDIAQLVGHYLPKPAIDPLTMRMTELVERRGGLRGEEGPEGGAAS